MFYADMTASSLLLNDIISTHTKLLLKCAFDPKHFFNLMNHLQSSSYLLCCSLKAPTPFCVNEQLVSYDNDGTVSSVDVVRI